MAEPKNKNVNGNHARNKSPPAPIHSKMWQFLDLAKEVARDADAVQEFEKSVETRRSLEQELEAKAVENQRLRELNDKVLREFSEFKTQAATKSDLLFAEFEQKFKAYDSNKSAIEAAEKELAGMKQRVEEWEAAQAVTADEVDRLKQRLKLADAHAKSQKEEINELNAECAIQRSQMGINAAELDTCKVKLGRAQKDLGEGFLREYGPEEFRQLGLDLQGLSKKLHSLAMEYFNDLDGAQNASSQIYDLRDRFTKVPMTAGPTRPAAYMRCVVAEAVFADVLTTQIFVPFYLSTDFQSAASNLLPIFGGDEHRRSIYRCQILQAMTDDEDVARVEEDIVRKASNEILTTLHSLMLPFKYSGFFHAVPIFFREALRLWTEVQRSRELITAEMSDIEEVQPGRYDEYDLASAPGSPTMRGGKTGSKQTVAAVLFPQVSTRDGVIFNGMALWTSQRAYMAAMSELPLNGATPETPKVRKRSMVGGELPFRSN